MSHNVSDNACNLEIMLTKTQELCCKYKLPGFIVEANVVESFKDATRIVVNFDSQSGWEHGRGTSQLKDWERERTKHCQH